MFTHIIFNLLKRFSRKEIIQLEYFLKSPYHNKSSKIKLLFAEIIKFYPDFKSQKLAKERLSLKINPGIKYNDSTLRDLMSGLLRCIEEFLICEEMNKNYPDKVFLLLKSYTDKNQDILFEKNFKKIRMQLESLGKDSIYYYNKSVLDMNKLNFNIINKYQKGAKLIGENNELRNSYLMNIIVFCIAELVNTFLKIKISGSKFRLDKKMNVPELLMNKIDPEYFSDLLKKENPDLFILEIYSNLLSAFQNLNTEKDFKKYKASFLKYRTHLSRDEISYHYSMLISFCILSNSLDKGKNKYDHELLALYESFLEGKFFCDEKTKHLDEDLYRNILLLGLRLRKFKWVYRFIRAYSKYLHPEKNENLLKLSYGEYYYYVGSTNKSKNILNKSFSYVKEIREESFVLKYDIRVYI
jgi:hypothetical protein